MIPPSTRTLGGSEAKCEADKNLDFFLGHLSNQFGEGGQLWEENRLHDVGARTKEQLEAYYFST